MTGLFLASLWLSAAIVGTTLISDDVARAAPKTPLQSLRFWVLCALGFGVAGMPLTMLSVGPLLSLAAAGVTGVLLGRALWPLFADSSADITLHDLAGANGRVLLPVDPEHGKIVVETRASRVELPARSGDGARLRIGQRVLVAFVKDGVAWVVGL